MLNRPVGKNLRSVVWLVLGWTAAAGCGASPEPHLMDGDGSQSEALLEGDAHLIWRLSQLEQDAMELSRLALHRTTNSVVLERQQSNLAQHQLLFKELNQAARHAHARMAPSMDAMGQKLWTQLFNKSGGHFERHLQVAQGQLHLHAAGAFEGALAATDDRRLHNYVLHAQTTWKKLN